MPNNNPAHLPKYFCLDGVTSTAILRVTFQPLGDDKGLLVPWLLPVDWGLEMGGGDSLEYWFKPWAQVRPEILSEAYAFLTFRLFCLKEPGKTGSNHIIFLMKSIETSGPVGQDVAQGRQHLESILCKPVLFHLACPKPGLRTTGSYHGEPFFFIFLFFSSCRAKVDSWMVFAS